MAKKTPFKTKSPTHSKELPGAPRQPTSPTGPLVSRGVPARLKNPTVASMQPTKGPIPATVERTVVRPLGPNVVDVDAAQAGAMGYSGRPPTTNGVIPKEHRDAIVPPGSFHVP